MGTNNILTKPTEFSLEFMKFPERPIFFNELTDLIKEFKGASREDFYIHNFKKRIENIIHHHTRLKSLSFYMPPLHDRTKDFNGTPGIYASYRKDYIDLMNAHVRQTGGKKWSFTAWSINERTGLIDGDKGIHEVILYISLDSIINQDTGKVKDRGSKLRASEIAAIILHEIGHLYYNIFFENEFVTTNKVLKEISDELKDDWGNEEKRVRVITSAIKENFTTDTLKRSLGELVKAESADVANIITFKELNDTIKGTSLLGSEAYDVTTDEAFADRYATMQGAGKDLVIALSKGHRENTKDNFSNSSILAINTIAMTVAGAVAISAPSPLTIPLLLGSVLYLGVNVSETKNDLTGEKALIYDNLEDRVRRIRQVLVKRISKNNVSKETIKSVLEQLDDIDRKVVVVKKLDTFRNNVVSRFLAKVLSSSYRKRIRALDIQREYEELAHNELFEKAARINIS